MQIDLLTPNQRRRRVPALLRRTAWAVIAAFAWVIGSPAPSLVVHHHAGDERGHTHASRHRQDHASSARDYHSAQHHHHDQADAEHHHGSRRLAHPHRHDGADEHNHRVAPEHTDTANGGAVIAVFAAEIRDHWHRDLPYAFCDFEIAWRAGAPACGRAPARVPAAQILAPTRGTLFARGPPAPRSIRITVLS